MKKTQLLYFIGLLLFLALTLSILLFSSRDSTSVSTSPVKGSTAPNFIAMQLDGTNVNLASLRGQWIILNFWATWCVPCKREMPELQAFYEDTGITVIGVNLAEDEELIAAWIRDYGITYPIALDPKEEIYSLYHIMGQPTTFVINPDGLIVELILGETTAENLLAIVEQ
jgi:peroxiredoxin